MAGTVQKLQAYKDKLKEFRRRYVDFDGQPRNPTLNLGGVFTGGAGDKINTVPERARFSLDRRLVPGEKLAVVERECVSPLKRCGALAWSLPSMRLAICRIASTRSGFNSRRRLKASMASSWRPEW